MLEDAEMQYGLAVDLDGKNPLAQAGLAEVKKLLAPSRQETPSNFGNGNVTDEMLRDAGACPRKRTPRHDRISKASSLPADQSA